MRRFARSALAITTVATGALLALAGTAAATEPPVSGDDRATAHEGNTTGKDCKKLFPGSTEISKSDLTHEVDASGTYLDITAVASGVDVAGVIVKGGPAYNVYEAGDLGDLPWLKLHSPLVPSGKPAQISHWFACGVKEKPTSSSTPTSTPTSSSSPTSTSTPTSTSAPTSSPTSSTPVTTTTTTNPVVAPVAGEDDLASTGFNGGWLVVLGAALLLGGGALLTVLRLRGAKR